MKRHGGIYRAATTADALHAAYRVARRGKRASAPCYAFERRLGANLSLLHSELADRSYKPKPLTSFIIHEPKLRLIEAPAFRDLVVQHAFYAQMMPLFERRFVRNSFACRHGYGTHACADYVQRMMRESRSDAWTLHLDVRKFFYSINRDILMRMLGRSIKCPDTLRLMEVFARRNSEKGIPIGNLLSQMFALVYLNEADHYIKRDLGVAKYARYMDDMILIADTRQQAIEWAAAVTGFLAGRLDLEVSKSHIAPIRRGINFCGFRTWRSLRVIRKHSLRYAARAARDGRLEAFVSCLGHARHSASYQYLMSYCQEHNHALYQALPESHRRLHHARDYAAA